MIRTSDVRRLARKDFSAGAMRHRINLLGVGGVGTNVMRQALRPGARGRLMFRIYDTDTIELHNLNRTSMFGLAQVGRKKVLAATDTSNQIHTEWATKAGVPVPDSMVAETFDVSVDAETKFRLGLVIDARDTLDPTKMPEAAWVKLAYDGGSQVSFTWKPAAVMRYVVDLTGGGSSYEVVPSFYVPAALLSCMTFNFMRYMNFLEITELRAGTFHMDIDGLAEDVSYVWEAEEEEEEASAEAEPAAEAVEAPVQSGQTAEQIMRAA